MRLRLGASGAEKLCPRRYRANLTVRAHGMGPRQLVQAWVEAFNRADVDALGAFYTDDAINHQVAESPVRGRDNIRQMFVSAFALTKMHCIVENIFEEGQWAILEWRDPTGLRGYGCFHVVDSRVKFQRGYWTRSLSCV